MGFETRQKIIPSQHNAEKQFNLSVSVYFFWPLGYFLKSSPIFCWLLISNDLISHHLGKQKLAGLADIQQANPKGLSGFFFFNNSNFIYYFRYEDHCPLCPPISLALFCLTGVIFHRLPIQIVEFKYRMKFQNHFCPARQSLIQLRFHSNTSQMLLFKIGSQQQHFSCIFDHHFCYRASVSCVSIHSKCTKKSFWLLVKTKDLSNSVLKTSQPN